MPTILRIGPYRFFFYSNEDGEPIHVHVIRDQVEAKFWIKPARLATNKGFPEHELQKIAQLVAENEETIENEWNCRKSR
ncbi:DUF4160 domain-containing protein [Victivallis sp. Marseille-Q1083]|uniref:DUF4160 domain-containing protein n=1 Tax=Victivallis sp. Marseille-Q1083 TaxID=2717288 RepID=UPI00158891AA|nr:DUF4160 domain-containing protein [Victivallis sp. Marseille-Q1083]